MAFSCGDDTSIEKVSLEGKGNGRPEELEAPTDIGESPVEDGDIFSCWATDLGDDNGEPPYPNSGFPDDDQSAQLFLPITNQEPSCVAKGEWPTPSKQTCI